MEFYRRKPLEKIQSSILNARTREQIVKVLKNIPQYYFMDNMHYEYYKRYVKPKLTLKYKIHNYIVWYYITLTDHYIVVNIAYKDQELYTMRNHVYIIGEDYASKKLFVNKANPHSIITVYDDSEKVFYVENIDVYKSSDQKVRLALRFDHDVDYDFNSSSEILVNAPGRYRVQGEVVIIVDHDDPLDGILYRNHVNRILESIYTELIAMILMANNLNVRIVNNNHVVIPQVVDRRDRVDDLCSVVTYIVKNGLGLKRYGNTLEGNGFSFDIDCTRDRFPFGRQYTDLIVSPVNIRDQRLESMIMNDIKDQVSRLKPQDTRLLFGRHEIILRNVIPTRLTYTPPPELFIGLVDPPSFEVDLQSFLVNENSEIVVRHEHHGEVTIRFSKDLVNSKTTYVRITTTDVSHDYAFEQNRVVISKLLSEIPKI